MSKKHKRPRYIEVITQLAGNIEVGHACGVCNPMDWPGWTPLSGNLEVGLSSGGFIGDAPAHLERVTPNFFTVFVSKRETLKRYLRWQFRPWPPEWQGIWEPNTPTTLCGLVEEYYYYCKQNGYTNTYNRDRILTKLRKAIVKRYDLAMKSLHEDNEAEGQEG